MVCTRLGEMSHGWSLDLKVKSTGFVDKFG